MSIINQMLRDLDARQASSQERAGLPSGLRTLPPGPRRPRALPWGLLVVGLIVGAAAVWFFASQSAPPPVALTEKSAAPQPIPVPTTPLAPSAESPIIAEPLPSSQAASPTASVVTASAPRSASAPVAKARSAATEKSEPSVSAPAAKLIAPPSPAPTGEQARPAALAAKPVETMPAAPTAGQLQIDKQPKTLPTRDLAETEYRKGVQAASQGDSATALPSLRRALELEPHHAKARQALLAVLASLRQWDEVKQVAQAGLTLDPARTGWATLLARLQFEEGDTRAALKTLDGHAAYAANDADFHALSAFLLHKTQRPAEAVQHYQTALRLRPNEGRWWFGLGLALEAAGRGEEARAAFMKAQAAGNLPAELLISVEERLRAASPSVPPPN